MTQPMPVKNWIGYCSVSVQYANQVVAKRKGAEDRTADSLRTLQMMQMIAWNAEHLANDSAQTIVQDNVNNTTNVSLIQQSIERDDNAESDGSLLSNKPPGSTQAKPKAVIPKSVMPKPVVQKPNNEY